MRCNELQGIAVCRSVMQCVSGCCSMLQKFTARCSDFQYVAVCCSALQCVAVCKRVVGRNL